ncbi:MAG: polysaccharide biosynthesis/export family protein, partial [Opitutales bacterium]
MMKHTFVFIKILFGAVVSLTAQENTATSSAFGETSVPAKATAGETASKPSAELTEAQRRYPLQPFDEISVQIFKHGDLSARQRISDVGTIALPLVGEIKIAGLTTSEAQRTIAAAFIDQEFLV